MRSKRILRKTESLRDSVISIHEKDVICGRNSEESQSLEQCRVKYMIEQGAFESEIMPDEQWETFLRNYNRALEAEKDASDE